ncbi:MAG: S46 family peptidase [Bacteroidales bacterium]|nr:S46 family peptidase [Bacteroidales bacterium]
MKFLFILFLSLIFVSKSLLLKADEGMWLPLLVERLNYDDMKKMGCKLTPEEIYSVNKSSLKDAIVLFGNGCTGEIISDKGLLLTNHHCGLSQIQKHSSVENDYLTHGFWAKSLGEELPNAGLKVSFLIRMEDVTKTVLDGVSAEMTEAERNAIIEKAARQIEKEAKSGTHYQSKVKAVFGGNEYYLFVYEVYEDVRMVGAPPWGIGKYGADTDNWMWPRHKGDFCLFRVYSGPDGKPAPYSTENIPLKPKHFLPISIKGVEKGDFAMILGYPGSTDRYMTSFGVKMLLEKTGPTIVNIRTKKLEIMRSAMNADDKVRIQYSSKQASVSNYWKYYIGQVAQLKRNKVLDRKQAIEKEFTNWINEKTERKNLYGTCLRDIEAAYEQLTEYEVASQYFYEAVYGGSEMIKLALNNRRFLQSVKNDFKNEDKEAVLKDKKDEFERHFKDYYRPLDREIFIEMMKMYNENVDVKYQPEYFKSLLKKTKGDYNKMAEVVFDKSIFSDKQKLLELCEKPVSFESDPAYLLMNAFLTSYQDIILKTTEANTMMERGNRLFIAGFMEMNPSNKFYPDANSTMRLTYGTVEDYFPADGIHYDYKTTLKGVMEKEVPNDWEFHVPEKLKEIYKKKDYGIYGENGELIVNFITNNDITGGNSGSPVINGQGYLIGLAFDGNWEAMSGDINFEPNLQRTICMDARYLLLVIDKYANAQNIMDELKIIK